MTTKEAPEFCAGVKILIERMETNPEDFAEGEYDYASMRSRRETKFGQVAKMLDILVSGARGTKEDVLTHWKEWNYLSKEEQHALLSAYKKMRRNQFDKQIMERVFDDNFYQRQEEEMLREQLMKQQMYQQTQVEQMRRAQQSGLISGTFPTITTTNTGGGLLGNVGIGGTF